MYFFVLILVQLFDEIKIIFKHFSFTLLDNLPTIWQNYEKIYVRVQICGDGIYQWPILPIQSISSMKKSNLFTFFLKIEKNA